MSSFSLILLASVLVGLSQANRCPRVPPGVDQMSFGVDITTLDIQPTGLSLDNRLKAPIIDFTCNQSTRWLNPADYEYYDIPDQVWKMVDHPARWPNIVTKIYEFSDQYKYDLAKQVDMEPQDGLFSETPSYQQIRGLFSSEDQIVVYDVSAFSQRSQVNLFFPPGVQLGKYAQMLVDSLPADYSQNPGAYLEFISYFGTHMFRNGLFGDQVRVMIKVNKSSLANVSDSDLQDQVERFLLTKLRSGSGDGRPNGPQSPEFKHGVIEGIYYYGNTRNSPLNSNYSGQIQKGSSAWSYGGTLRPIYFLITDEAKQKSMQQAMELYMASSLIKDMDAKLKGAMSLYHLANNVSILADLQEGITNLSRSRDVDIKNGFDRLDGLKYSLKEHLETPIWWKDVRFCLHNQENVTDFKSIKHCSGPNRYTPYSGYSGANMQWGMFLPYPSPERWLQTMQLCFKTNSATQIRVNNSYNTTKNVTTSCVGMTKFTDIIDLFNKSSGNGSQSHGSYYSYSNSPRIGVWPSEWTVVVPEGSRAPFWLLNGRICLWNRDYQQEMCARVNTFSEFNSELVKYNWSGDSLRWGFFYQTV